MLRARTSVASMLVVAVLVLGCAPAEAGPKYASDETRTVIENMIEAHGGFETWENTKTLAFNHILHIPNGPWMVKREIVDLNTRQTYQDWPLLEAKLSFDGEKAWTEGWPQPFMPPKAAVYTGFMPGAIVWLTQDESVSLSEPRTGTFAGDPEGSDATYHIVRMTHEGGSDYYELYINTETHVLRGFETIVTYGGLLDSMGLPPQMKSWGPMYHNFRSYQEVDGLIFPESWITRMVQDEREIGQHLLINFALNETFDTSRMTMPPNAVLDTSSAERRAQ